MFGVSVSAGDAKSLLAPAAKDGGRAVQRAASVRQTAATSPLVESPPPGRHDSPGDPGGPQMITSPVIKAVRQHTIDTQLPCRFRQFGVPLFFGATRAFMVALATSIGSMGKERMVCRKLGWHLPAFVAHPPATASRLAVIGSVALLARLSSHAIFRRHRIGPSP